MKEVRPGCCGGPCGAGLGALLSLHCCVPPRRAAVRHLHRHGGPGGEQRGDLLQQVRGHGPQEPGLPRDGERPPGSPPRPPDLPPGSQSQIHPQMLTTNVFFFKFIYSWLCWGFIAARAFLWLQQAGGYSLVGVQRLLFLWSMENPRDRGAWWATVHRVTRSRIQLSMHTHIYVLHQY